MAYRLPILWSLPNSNPLYSLLVLVQSNLRVTVLELGQQHMQLPWVSLIRLFRKWEDGIRMLLNITFVSSHSSYNMYIHIYYTPVSGVFCPLGRPFLAFQALSANIYLHSSEVFCCSFLRLSHYGSSEVFCCPLVCIITTYRQYRSILLTLSPKFLFFFMHV